MMFNQGFLCRDCGPMEKATSKTINKVKHDICPMCSKVVTPWERPLNERPGRCSHCAYGSFTLAIVKSRLIRCCKRCLQVDDADTGQVHRKGKENFKYEPGKK